MKNRKFLAVVLLIGGAVIAAGASIPIAQAEQYPKDSELTTKKDEPTVDPAKAAADYNPTARGFAQCAGIFDALMLISLSEGADASNLHTAADAGFRFYRAAREFDRDSAFMALAFRDSTLRETMAIWQRGEREQVQKAIASCTADRNFLVDRNQW